MKQPNGGPPALFLVAIVSGFAASLWGTYWDAGWHTVRGRDEFLSPPHLLLYAGISLVGAAFVLRAALLARRADWRGALTIPALRLGLLGAAVTLAAGPIDDVWHRAFGRDAVIWSPPHMLGVLGTLTISAAVLIEARRAPSPRRWFELMAGAGLLASCLIPVLEYDLDVPQFSETFYLPVVATGATFAFAVIALGSERRYPATTAAAVYTAVMGVLGLSLSLWDYPAPALPLLLAAALAFDTLRRRAPLARGLAVAALVYAAYVPIRAAAGAELALSAGQVAAGLLLASAGSLLVLLLVEGRMPTRMSAAATVLLLLVLLPGTALAHDPGQGAEVGRAGLVATASGSLARLDVDLRRTRGCGSVRPRRLRARRAGQVVTAGLVRSGPCRATGTVRLRDNGRWFLYAEFERSGKPLETWIPVTIGDPSEARDSDRLLYAPRAKATTAPKVAAGVVVYALMLVVMAVVAGSVRTAVET